MIYLDNAATSWPKPECVYTAIDSALREKSGNPGRSGHKLSLAANRVIEEARFLLAQLFHVSKPESIIFTLNATDSLNLAIKGTLSYGDHVVTSSMEHNSVVRPLEELKTKGICITKVKTSPITGVDIDAVKSVIQNNTKLMIFSHVSNVTGAINPIQKIGQLCREKSILFLVDAAQSAGVVPIDVHSMNIDLLAFPGHKGLLGPQGTGGLFIREGIFLKTLKEGGTGSHSSLLTQPLEFPYRYESGTPNTPGIAGLAAGVRYILQETVKRIQARESYLACRFIDGIQTIPGLSFYGPPAGSSRSGVVLINFENMDATESAIILDSVFDIGVRSGLHCSPDAHKTIGTFERGGALRISIGNFNNEKDVDSCLKALCSLSTKG